MPVYTQKKGAIPMPMTEKQVREILGRADRNRDGRLSKDELKKALKELGSRLACYRVRHCLKNVDANRDGQISAAELDGLVDYILKWHADKVKN